MSNSFDPLPQDVKQTLTCCYANRTSKIQVARVTNIPSWYFERVVFPGQRLIFEADAQAQLEIHTGMMASAILSDTIPCTRLTIGCDLASDPTLDDEGDRNEHPHSPSVTDITSQWCQDLELSIPNATKQPSTVL